MDSGAEQTEEERGSVSASKLTVVRFRLEVGMGADQSTGRDQKTMHCGLNMPHTRNIINTFIRVYANFGLKWVMVQSGFIRRLALKNMVGRLKKSY